MAAPAIQSHPASQGLLCPQVLHLRGPAALRGGLHVLVVLRVRAAGGSGAGRGAWAAGRCAVRPAGAAGSSVLVVLVVRRQRGRGGRVAGSGAVVGLQVGATAAQVSTISRKTVCRNEALQLRVTVPNCAVLAGTGGRTVPGAGGVRALTGGLAVPGPNSAMDAAAMAATSGAAAAAGTTLSEEAAAAAPSMLPERWTTLNAGSTAAGEAAEAGPCSTSAVPGSCGPRARALEARSAAWGGEAGNAGCSALG